MSPQGVSTRDRPHGDFHQSLQMATFGNLDSVCNCCTMDTERLVAKATITTPFPSVSDTAEILSVPSGRVERLEQLLSSKPVHRSAKRAGKSAKSVTNSARVSAKKRRK